MNGLISLIKKQNNWLLDLISLGLFLVVFYFLWLGHYPLFNPDESRYSEVAREMFISHDYITPRVDHIIFLDKPILYYWLQTIAIAVFGLKYWALRFFPALFGISTVMMTYFTGRQLFNRETGLISACILASTPIFFGGAHYANLDLEVASWITFTLYFFILGVKRESNDSWFFITSYICAAFAFLTKGMIGIVFPMVICGMWLLCIKRISILKRMKLLLGALLFLIIACPWYLLVQKANPSFFHYFFIIQQMTRFLSQAKFNNPSPIFFYLPVILIGFFPWTLFLLQAIYQTIKNCLRNLNSHQNELFFLIWFTFIFIFFSVPESKTIGYILPVFPALSLLVGNYLVQTFKNKISSLNYVMIFSLIFWVIIAEVLFSSSFNTWFLTANIPAPYFYIFANLFLLSGIFTFFCWKFKKPYFFFANLFFTNIIILLTCLLLAKPFNDDSTHELTKTLNSIIKPTDEVVVYYKYYQDVPFYLKKRVTVVADWHSPNIAIRDNWRRELWFGMALQNPHDWLIDENVFWQHWNSDKRVYVFFDRKYFAPFIKHTQVYYFVGLENNIALFTNKPLLVKPVL